MLTNRLVFILALNFANGIMVLKSQSPLLESAFAEIINSSLSKLDTFTMCARFFPYQFQNTFRQKQAIISTNQDSALFGSITTSGDCNKTDFEGCSKFYKQKIGDKWKYGGAFGYTDGVNSKLSWEKFFGKLKIQMWYGICIIIDTTLNTYDLFIENEKFSLEHSFGKSSFNPNIRLFNVPGADHKPFYGEITDLNVWSTKLSKINIQQFISCENQGSGDFLSWTSAHFNLNGLDTNERNISNVCRKQHKEPIQVYTNPVKSTEEHLKFCNSIGSLVASAKNEEEMKSMAQIFFKTDMKIRWQPEYFFLGYIFDVNAFVDINDKNITINWESHKNYTPVGENPKCMLSNGSVILGDSCDYAINPMCKAKENLIDFQMRGVCLDSGGKHSL